MVWAPKKVRGTFGRVPQSGLLAENDLSRRVTFIVIGGVDVQLSIAYATDERPGVIGETPISIDHR